MWKHVLDFLDTVVGYVYFLLAAAYKPECPHHVLFCFHDRHLQAFNIWVSQDCGQSFYPHCDSRELEVCLDLSQAVWVLHGTYTAQQRKARHQRSETLVTCFIVTKMLPFVVSVSQMWLKGAIWLLSVVVGLLILEGSISHGREKEVGTIEKNRKIILLQYNKHTLW